VAAGRRLVRRSRAKRGMRRSRTKCHWLPFLVWCISGSRVPLLFLVELGAAIRVASTTVPCLSSRPLAVSVALTVARICTLRLWASSRWRKRKMVLSSGRWSSPMSRPANSRNMGVSYSASSMAGSDRSNHCCRKWMRSMVSTGNGGAPAFGAARRGKRGNQRHQFRPGHHQAHLVQKFALARPLGLALEPRHWAAQAHRFHADTVSHPAVNVGGWQTFPNPRDALG